VIDAQFIANIAHDLRAPLNTIIGFSELMYDGRVGPLSDDHREYLGDILAGAKDLLRLINDVVDLAKAETANAASAAEPIDLSHLVSEVRELVRVQAARKRIRIAIDVDPQLGDVVLDRVMVKQILYCQLSSALAFAAPEGGVRIRARPDAPGMFRLEVDDVRGESGGGSRFDVILPRKMLP